MHIVEPTLASRASAAAMSLAETLGLHVDDAVVIQNSNRLALRLLPCDTVVRAALLGQAVAGLEVAVAQQLSAVNGPIGPLDARVEPRVYHADGFAITFWTYLQTTAAHHESPAAYADTLHRLHAGLRMVSIEAPRYTRRVAAARRLVKNQLATPALAQRDRELLLRTLDAAGQAIRRHAVTEQLLHGEPHPGNLINTTDGPVFIDLETCCLGPIEFDLAYVPDQVSAHYSGADQALLQQCRRLVLAMVAAWRWNVHDEFPHGLRHGRSILDLLRNGPPWPAIGALSIGESNYDR